ncbi:MAG: ComEC family competence protein, partial [candidate division Zixibacteria bacterium]|nr:ComEC family competence protein [candidate division Zixibacteria bacterium]
MADQTHWSSWTFLLPALFFALTGLLSFARQGQSRAALLLALSMLFFSAFHFAIKAYDTGPHHVSNFTDPGVRYHIFGRVSDWPVLKSNRTEIKVRVDSLVCDRSIPVNGSVLLKVTDTTTALQRGDRLEFYGRIYPLPDRRQPGSFDYGRFLKLRGVFGLVYMPNLLDLRVDKGNRYGASNLTDRLRQLVSGSFQRNLSPTAAALAAGFLIGETRDIPAEIYTMFRDSGTLHLLAVSGSNVAIVLLFFVYIMRPLSLSRLKRSIALLAVVGLFTLLSYGEPSVVRASIMASLVILAKLLERRFDLNNIIAATALIILLFEPTQLFNIGFQLSFVTAWGLIFVTPQVHRRFHAYHTRRWYRFIVFPVMISFIAQICSAPL